MRNARREAPLRKRLLGGGYVGGGPLIPLLAKLRGRRFDTHSHRLRPRPVKPQWIRHGQADQFRLTCLGDVHGMRRHRCCGAARRLPTSSRPSRVTVAIESADCASMMPAPATTTARPRNSPTRAVMEPPEDVGWSTSLLPAGTQRRPPEWYRATTQRRKRGAIVFGTACAQQNRPIPGRHGSCVPESRTGLSLSGSRLC